MTSGAASIGVWTLATLAHLVLSAYWVDRLTPRGTSTDARTFAVIVAAIGGLACALHLLASTIGIGLVRGVMALAVIHASAWVTLRRRPATSAAFSNDAAVDSITRAAELAAGAVCAAIVASWIGIAAQSSAVYGTDAAHYHVPHAVNLALGGSLFDLPATPHLYPMAGSTLLAWFIVPTHDARLVDLAMTLPFLLMAASMNWLFRLTTGLSGLAWASWVTLALFGTPMFRQSADVSADLWFAASFVALAAVLVSWWNRGRLTAVDAFAGAVALGLLVGSKTTGAPAAALLVGAFALAALIRPRMLRPHVSWRGLAAGSCAVIVIIFGSGAIWLVRNWVRFGSPTAPTGLVLFGMRLWSGDPWAPTTYLSVLGDRTGDPSYPWMERTLFFARQWLGRWYAPALVLAALVPIDLLVARLRRVESTAVGGRALLLWLTLVSGVVLTWMLMGAPWTSLEWTRGLALRYVLPFCALLPLIAFVALFPLSVRWYVRSDVAAFALALISVAALVVFVPALHGGGPRFFGLPTVLPVWGSAGAVAFLAWQLTMRTRPRPIRLAASLAIAALLTIAWTPLLAGRTTRDRAAQAAQLDRDVQSWASIGPASTSPHRAVYLAMLDAEARAGRTCDARRIFSLIRDDEPLQWQSGSYRNRIYYAARDTSAAATAAPLGPCDYVVTTRVLTETDKGRALTAALSGGATLERSAETPDFLVLRGQ
jgi:hypothetical protein